MGIGCVSRPFFLVVFPVDLLISLVQDLTLHAIFHRNGREEFLLQVLSMSFCIFSNISSRKELVVLRISFVLHHPPECSHHHTYAGSSTFHSSSSTFVQRKHFHFHYTDPDQFSPTKANWLSGELPMVLSRSQSLASRPILRYNEHPCLWKRQPPDDNGQHNFFAVMGSGLIDQFQGFVRQAWKENAVQHAIVGYILHKREVDSVTLQMVAGGLLIKHTHISS